jgi:hypothetical protein
MALMLGAQGPNSAGVEAAAKRTNRTDGQLRPVITQSRDKCYLLPGLCGHALQHLAAHVKSFCLTFFSCSVVIGLICGLDGAVVFQC